MPTKGRGVRAKDRRISEWKTRDGAIKGDEWMYQRPEKLAVRVLTYDSNYWKSKIHEALVAPISNRFALAFYQEGIDHHKMIGRHCVAEKPTRVTTDHRTADEWSLPPNKPDNHLWDCLVSCTALASYGGLSRTGGKPQLRKRRRRRVRHASGN